jgi:hypothetical protein
LARDPLGREKVVVYEPRRDEATLAHKARLAQ